MRDRILLTRVEALIHQLRPGARTLILGSGGVQDVIGARLTGGRDVTAVDPYRIALTVLLPAPLDIAMGMPMPVGIRLLASQRPELVPWTWGVNGAASVLGSVAALCLALVVGFTPQHPREPGRDAAAP